MVRVVKRVAPYTARSILSMISSCQMAANILCSNQLCEEDSSGLFSNQCGASEKREWVCSCTSASSCMAQAFRGKGLDRIAERAICIPVAAHYKVVDLTTP